MSRKTIPRETEKPKKLTRAQKKEIDAVLRKYKGDGKPRTAQATIPYEAIYPDGVCRIDRRTFSKCIAFEDISYQLAQPETRTAIFEHLCDLYNYVDASIHVQLSFLNRKVDPVQYAKSFEIAPQGDDFDDIRAEYTAILQKQLASGNNGIVKTKYLTFTIEADSLKTARARLTRIGLDLLGYFKTMGCVAHVMDGQARLEVLHGIFHPDGEPFRFDWDWLAPSGLSTKDFVAPSSLCFGTAKTFGLGGKYGAVSFLQILAPELSDEMLADFLKTESGILVNLHVQAIDQTEAIKTIKRKITDLDAMKIQEQKKAVRSGYDMDILPSDLATYGEDAKKLLNKLQTRNERLFMLTFLVLNVADTKQKLGNDVFQAAGVAQKYNCSLIRLDYQQEQGLVSSLPLGIRFQPVAHLRLPAVVDLKQVSRAKQAAASGQVLPDGVLGDVLIAVVPAGIASQLLFSSRTDAHSPKPTVKHFGLAALGKKQVEQGNAAAGMLHPGAVTLQRQQGFAAVVAEDGVARGLVQRCHQLELPALAEIAVGKAVALTVMMSVGHKMIIAVAVKGIFLQ